MFGGTLTRANRRIWVEGSRTTTARFSDRSEMYGNGWAGSTDSGVRIGNTRFSNVCRRCTRSSPRRSSQSTTLIPAASNRGRTLFAQIWFWRFMSRRTRRLIASSCSRAVIPSGDVEARPTDTCSLSPATRIWKNSSRLMLKIARNRTRSRSGRVLSSASASTRASKSSQESSRLANLLEGGTDETAGDRRNVCLAGHGEDPRFGDG